MTSANQDRRPSDADIESAPKRARYVTRACQECQKRKVKCTGEQPGPCQQCKTSAADCHYDFGPRKRRNTGKPRLDNGPLIHPGSPPVVRAPEAVSMALAPETAPQRRVDDAQTYGQGALPYTARPHHSTPDGLVVERHDQHQPQQSDPAVTDTITVQQDFVDTTPLVSSVVNAAPLVYPHGGPGQKDDEVGLAPGGTNSQSAIAEFDLVVATGGVGQLQVDDKLDPYARCSALKCSSFPLCCQGDLRICRSREDIQETDELRMTLRTYFEYLNPHYPCLNETQFFSQFEDYIENENKYQPGVETVEFVALVQLVLALVRVLEGYCTHPSEVPGWEHFTRASHLLNHTTWLARGTLLTIQCLIIKATYLSYAEEHSAAYEAVGQALRLCYQIGLHNQPSWHDCSPFEFHMRQRVFWSVYCLERNIAQVCGVPYLIRESEFKIDLPAAVDDRQLGRMEHLPVATPSSSSMPYLYGVVEWARLSSEIWDRVFGVNASNLGQEDFTIIMDTKLVSLSKNLPEHLQWKSSLVEKSQSQCLSNSILRQAMILHLRINHLRLLLRQASLLDYMSKSRHSESCLSIASSTVDAVYNFYHSPLHQKLDRHSCVTYLTGAIVSLAGLIIRGTSASEAQTDAALTFRKAINVLWDIAPGLAMARRTLKRLDRVIDAVEKLIKGWPSVMAMELEMTSTFHAPPLPDLDAETAAHGVEHISLDFMNTPDFTVWWH